MQRKALSQKILILGIDGMDPRLTKKYLKKGLLPNIEKYLKNGAAREDLVLLGGVPTITPPMWTTLSTGAYPNTHGLTCFWGQKSDKIDTFCYNLDSSRSKAEPLWNVFVEAGKKTLVWHWPGCSWPPTSDNPNLHVVEGTQPSAVNWGIAKVDDAHIVIADTNYSETKIITRTGEKIPGVGCVMDDMEADDNDIVASFASMEPSPISMNPHEGECQHYGKAPFVTYTPIEDAHGWEITTKGCKEFSVMTCDDRMVRRICLLTPNEAGIFDTVSVFTNKKSTEPIITLKNDEWIVTAHETIPDKHGDKKNVTRSYTAFDMAQDGSHVVLYFGAALDTECDDLFSPKSLYAKTVKNVGYIPSIELESNLGSDPHLLHKIMNRSYKYYDAWQAKAIDNLIKEEHYEVVFSHLHNLDNFGHVYWEHHNTFGNEELDAEYEKLFEEVYQDTDTYLGYFLPYLDEGWTILITSDHGLLCKEEPDICPGIGDAFVVNTTIMRELGYTVMKKDQFGNETREIDYSKTKAVATRGNHIYINMKDRYEYGIVDESEKYELEREIIDSLYNYRNKNGKRIIALAIRNKDAALLGLSGPESGDILYWLEEGFNRLHGDSLSTTLGVADTSVSPIFIIAGAGVKHNFYTDRVIRQVDVTPTLAIIGGVRMPAQCEGAPVYQILEEEF